MRIFINHVNTYSGYALCAGLRRFNGVTNRMFGTTVESFKDSASSSPQSGPWGDEQETGDPTRLPVPPSIRRIIFKRNPQQLMKNLLSCSLIVYDLHTASPEEIEDIIKKLRRSTIEKPTVFVLISSVMVWAGTKQELVEHDSENDTKEEEGDEDVTAGRSWSERDANQSEVNEDGSGPHPDSDEDDTDDNDSISSEERNEKEKGEMEEDDEPLPDRFKGTKSISGIRRKRKSVRPERKLKPKLLRVSELERRIPSKRYEKWKTIETLVMSLNSKDNLTTYVVAAGAMYGHGEGPFYPAFKAAWLGLQTHRIIGKLTSHYRRCFRGAPASEVRSTP